MTRLWLRAALSLAVAGVVAMVAATGAYASADATVVRTLMGSGKGFHHGYADCPAGMFATGGGVGLSGGSNANSSEFVSDSGPVDSTGSFRDTTTGQVPVEWYGTTHIAKAAGPAYVWVVCSPTATTVVRATVGSTAGFHSAFATCPRGQEATGGGIGVDGGTSPETYESISDSGPVDSTGEFVHTTTGAVPVQWYGTSQIETSGTTAYVWAVCSQALAVTVVRKTIASRPGYFANFARCPFGQRATGGGLGVDGGSASGRDQVIGDSGPVNASLSFDRTTTGKVPIQWDGASSIPHSGTTAYVWAVCG